VTVAYPVFLCAAMLPWVFFAEVLNRGCGSLRGNASFLRKLPVGEHLFVAETAVSACVTLVIQMLLLCILATAWGHPPMWTWLAVPLPLAMLAVTGFGLALGLATLNAFFPDVQQVLGTVLRLAIWAAPVVFPLSFYENHGLGGIVQFNPATPALSAVREMFIDGRIPGPAAWGLMLAWAAAALLAGGLIFRALRHEIRDVV
jgi:ABC-type polysaccharide/polyol phosphate export permease